MSIWVTETQEAEIRSFLSGRSKFIKTKVSGSKVSFNCQKTEGDLIFPNITCRGPEAKVVVEGHMISVKLSSFCEDTNKLLRGHRFTWSKPCWVREAADFISAENKAVEISLRLLKQGCPVSIPDQVLREKVVAGDYEPEPSRVLDAVHHEKYGTRFLFTWFPEDGSRYRSIHQYIRGAKVFDNAAYVDALNFDVALDFAEYNGFVVTEAALELISRGQEIRDKSLSIRPQVKPFPITPAKRAALMPANGEIDEELADI